MTEKKGRPSLNTWNEDIKAAKELFYPKEVIEALEREPNPIRRSRILASARRATTK